MNYKKYLLIILTICFGTSVSFANLQVKADSVVVNTTDPVGNQQEKTEKPKKSKETKAKNKDSKTKGKEKAKGKDSKAAIKAPKVSKKTQTTEYKAKRQATVEALDSIIKTTGRSTVITPDHLMSFLDEKCKEFDWDPVLMDSIASAMYTLYGNEVWGERRFIQLKQRHPTFVEAYYTEGLLFHTLAWINSDGVSYDPEFLAKAKVQIDSAKLIVPESEEPYMLWVKWQGKYDPEGVATEIDTLKMRIPNYPGYLEVARDFDRYSTSDRTFLPSAMKFYGKAEHEAMKIYDYVNYALICYRYGDITKEKNAFKEGIAIANEGLGKFPNYPGLIRMKLWNEAGQTTVPRLPDEEKKEMWDSAYVTSQRFIALPDTVERQANDYRWLGMVNMETKHYSDAIKYIKQQLKMGVPDSIQHALALRNIVDCYTSLEIYDNAIAAFDDYRSYKESKNMEITLFDYSKLLNVYNYMGQDTLNMTSERLACFHKADSVLDIMGKISVEDLGYVNNMRLGVTMQIIQTEEGELNITRPEILTACIRLAQTILAIPESERKANDYYYLMRAYRYAMEHYLYTDMKGESWLVSDFIMEMPLDMELPDMSKSRAREYGNHMNRATTINGLASYATAANKLKKSGWNPFK